jgi:hypothetical protein
MKKHLLKTLFSFIIITMMFSVTTGSVKAQQEKAESGKKKPPLVCNCLTRPIPFKCGQICGFLSGEIENDDELLSHSSLFVDKQSVVIRFSLAQPVKISAKIFDITGRLVKAFTDEVFESGEHELEWNTANASIGVYSLQLSTANKSEMKKQLVAK